jgi:hypothetical protein
VAAAIETGQEVDRADIKLRGSVNAEEELLRKAFTFEELAEMDARVRGAASGQVVAVKGLLGPETTNSPLSEGVGGANAPKSRESWKD